MPSPAQVPSFQEEHEHMGAFKTFIDCIHAVVANLLIKGSWYSFHILIIMLVLPAGKSLGRVKLIFLD
jgi:hypothetical protein